MACSLVARRRRLLGRQRAAARTARALEAQEPRRRRWHSRRGHQPGLRERVRRDGRCPVCERAIGSGLHAGLRDGHDPAGGLVHRRGHRILGCASTSATLACDTNGEASRSGCDAEQLEVERWMTCAEAPQDGACAAWLKVSCCEATRAYAPDRSKAAHDACISSCADDACMQTCAMQYATVVAAEASMGQWMQDSCTSPCLN